MAIHNPSADNFKVFSGTKSVYLAEKICRALNRPLGQINYERFSDGEFTVSYEESVRGQYVYLVQSTFPNSDNLMELLLMVDAARRASAYKVAAVIPYFGWARQDRKDKPRVAIAAKLVADMLTVAGVDRVMTMDLHAEQIQGFFNIPVDHLYGSTVFVPYIKSLKLKNLVIASPDVGGAKRAGSYSKYLDVPMVICHKTRERANVVADMKIIGEVYGKNVVLMDDMIDTGGTLCKAADLMLERGAASVRAVVSHGVMSGNAIENVNNSGLTELVFSDSIPFDTALCPKVHILSVAEMFADTIIRNQQHRPISELYIAQAKH